MWFLWLIIIIIVLMLLGLLWIPNHIRTIFRKILIDYTLKILDEKTRQQWDAARKTSDDLLRRQMEQNHKTVMAIVRKKHETELQNEMGALEQKLKLAHLEKTNKYQKQLLDEIEQMKRELGERKKQALAVQDAELMNLKYTSLGELEAEIDRKRQEKMAELQADNEQRSAIYKRGLDERYTDIFQERNREFETNWQQHCADQIKNFQAKLDEQRAVWEAILTSDLDKHHDDLNGLQNQKIKELNVQINHLMQECEGKNTELTRQRAQLDDINRSVNAAQLEHNEFTAKIATCRKDLSTAEKDLQNKQTELTGVQGVIDAKCDFLKQIEKDLQRISAEYAASQDETANVKKALTTAQIDLHKVQTDLATQTDRLTTLTAEYDTLVTHKVRDEGELHVAQEQLRTILQQRDDLEKEIETVLQPRKAQLEAALSEIQSNSDRLRGEMTELNAERVRWQADLDERKKEKINLLNDIKLKQGQKTEVFTDVQRLQSQQSDLQKKIDKLWPKKNGLENDIKKFISQKNDLQKDINQLGPQKQQLEKDIGALRPQKEAIEADIKTRLNPQKEAIETDINTRLKPQKEAIEADIDTRLNPKKEQLERDIDELGPKEAELKATIGQLVSECGALQNEKRLIDEAKESVEKETNKLDAKKIELEGQIDTLEQETKTLSAEAADLSACKKLLDAEIANLNNLKSLLTGDKNDLENDKSELKKNKKILQHDNDALIEFQNKLVAGLKPINSEIMAEIAKLTVTTNGLKKEIAELQPKEKELQKKKEDLERETTQLEAEKTSISSDKDAIQTKRDELNGQIDAFETTKNNLKKAIDDLIKEIGRLNEERSKGTVINNNIQNTQIQQQNNLNLLELQTNRISQLQGKVNTLDSEVKKRSDNKATLEKTNRELRAEKTSLKNEINKLKEDKPNLKKEIDQLKQEQKALNTEINQLKQQQHELQNGIEQKGLDADGLEASKTALQIDVAALQTQKIQLEARIKELEERFKALTSHVLDVETLMLWDYDFKTDLVAEVRPDGNTTKLMRQRISAGMTLDSFDSDVELIISLLLHIRHNRGYPQFYETAVSWLDKIDDLLLTGVQIAVQPQLIDVYAYAAIYIQVALMTFSVCGTLPKSHHHITKLLNTYFLASPLPPFNHTVKRVYLHLYIHTVLNIWHRDTYQLTALQELVNRDAKDPKCWDSLRDLMYQPNCAGVFMEKHKFYVENNLVWIQDSRRYYDPLFVLCQTDWLFATLFNSPRIKSNFTYTYEMMMDARLGVCNPAFVRQRLKYMAVPKQFSAIFHYNFYYSPKLGIIIFKHNKFFMQFMGFDDSVEQMSLPDLDGILVDDQHNVLLRCLLGRLFLYDTEPESVLYQPGSVIPCALADVPTEMGEDLVKRFVDRPSYSFMGCERKSIAYRGSALQDVYAFVQTLSMPGLGYEVAHITVLHSEGAVLLVFVRKLTAKGDGYYQIQLLNPGKITNFDDRILTNFKIDCKIFQFVDEMKTNAQPVNPRAAAALPMMAFPTKSFKNTEILIQKRPADIHLPGNQIKKEERMVGAALKVKAESDFRYAVVAISPASSKSLPEDAIKIVKCDMRKDREIQFKVHLSTMRRTFTVKFKKSSTIAVESVEKKYD